MRSRLRGAGAGQSAVKGTRGGGAAAGPRGAFPYHGPCQVQPTSGLPLGAGGVCIWGRSSEKGKLWATPSQRRHGGPPGQGWEGWAALAAATHLQGPPAEAEVPGPEGDPGPTSHLRGHSQEWGLPWHDWCSRAGAHHRRQPTTPQPWDCGALRSAASRRPGPAYCTHSPKRPVEPPLPQTPRPFPEAHPTLHARKRCSRTSGWDTAVCMSTQGAPAAGHGASARLALES